MAASLQFPPTERDFRIYERVVLAGISTRQAASEFRLSQTRIRQLVQRVSQWLTETVPAQSEATDAAHLCYARHVAAARLEYFYSEAMEGWRSDRQPKYLSLAIRVTTAQAKLPVLPSTLECLAADAIEGPLTDDTSSPPPRDCSAASPLRPAAPVMPTRPPAASPHTAEALDELPVASREARRSFFSTAHPLADDRDESPVTEIKITPQTLGFAMNKALSRKERRRLKRSAMAK
jgi:hypothetical protein